MKIMKITTEKGPAKTLPWATMMKADEGCKDELIMPSPDLTTVYIIQHKVIKGETLR